MTAVATIAIRSQVLVQEGLDLGNRLALFGQHPQYPDQGYPGGLGLALQCRQRFRPFRLSRESRSRASSSWKSMSSSFFRRVTSSMASTARVACTHRRKYNTICWGVPEAPDQSAPDQAG